MWQLKIKSVRPSALNTTMSDEYEVNAMICTRPWKNNIIAVEGEAGPLKETTTAAEEEGNDIVHPSPQSGGRMQ